METIVLLISLAVMAGIIIDFWLSPNYNEAPPVDDSHAERMEALESAVSDVRTRRV